MKTWRNPLTVLVSLLWLLHAGCSPVSPLQPNVATGGRAVSVARHPNNNNEFFVASESGGIFKSTDAGVKWKHVSGTTTFWFTDVIYCKNNPDIIIATASNDTKVTTGGGVWRSTNSGTSWTQIPLTTPAPGCGATITAFSLATEPGNNRIWVGTSCGLAVSTDDGASFTFIATSANYNNDAVYAVLAPATDQIKILTDGGVKVSTNGGTDWLFSTTGLPYVAKGEHAQIACSPLNHEHIYWASNFSPWDGQWHNGIYFSSDNGNTWTNLIDNIGINRRPTCFTALSLSGANKFDLYYSDGGCTLKRAAFTNATPPAISGSWSDLAHPHCDFADLSFKTDGKSPALLVGDGGIFSTTNNGANWAFTGGGNNGYNALQITEVVGQLHGGDDNSDLYYATQDNDIRSSPDGGATWPATQVQCCEGFFLSVPRESLPAADTKFTGVNCGACYNFMGGALLAGGLGGFPNVTNATNSPFYLKPGAYLQSDTLPGAPTVSIFQLTTNNGGSWNPKYSFVNEQRDLSKSAGPAGNPVVFTAVKKPGTTADGNEIVGIKKIVGVLGSGSPVVSEVNGFGSLGIFPTMFAWYKPFGADTHDPNHMIVPDITTDKVRVTRNGGMTWENDTLLTRLVTQSGAFKFRWGPFTQISTIAFDPDVRGRILVGTVQSGVYCSCDGGNKWEKIKDTEAIPNVSKVYFPGKNRAIVSSYGRGLWTIALGECPKIKRPKITWEAHRGPLIYWKGAYVPLDQIDDPDVCPVCGFFLVERGDITQVRLSENGETVSDISISEGTLKGYTFDEKDISDVPFKTSQNGKAFDPGNDEQFHELMEAGFKVKGVYTEGRMFKGYILAKDDIKANQLPKKRVLKTNVNTELVRDPQSGNVRSLKIRARGFDKNTPIEILLDGKKLEVRDKNPVQATFDENGDVVLELTYFFTPGGHTLILEQRKADEVIREAVTFVIPLNDKEREKEKQG